MEIKNKVIIIITGATSGIGRAIAIELKKAGGIVIVSGRRRESKDSDIPTDVLINAEFIKCDVRNIDEIKNLIDTVVRKYGRIDVLINNAGIVTFSSLHDLTLEEYEEVMNTNLRSAVFASKFALEYMLKQETGGVIINISSVSGMEAEPDMIVYAISKAGMNSLTVSAAVKYGEKVRFVAICPGYIRTKIRGTYELPKEELELIPMKRQGTPEEVAKLVRHVIENDYINGSLLVIDGGLFQKVT